MKRLIDKIPKACIECDYLEYAGGDYGGFECTLLPHDLRDFANIPVYTKRRRADCPLEDD